MDSKTKLEIKESDFADFDNIPTNEELAWEPKRFRVHSITRKASLAMFK
jgi:hypothetical protein